MLHYLILHKFNDALIVVALFNTVLFDVVLIDFSLFNVAVC